MIQTRHLFTLTADVPRIVDMGATPSGHRRIRTTPVFETASPKYDWLNRIIAVASGRREKYGPMHEVYEVL